MLWSLFIGFLRVGLFTFGGAYGAIPLIRDLVLSNGWLTEDAFTYMIAVSESTPGSIMVCMATYVGSDQAGFLGAVAATLGVVLPSFVVILLAMNLFNALLKSRYFKAFLNGMSPAVVGIVLATGVSMTLSAVAPAWAWDWKALVITALLAGCLLGTKRLFKKKLSPIALISLSALLGILFYGV